MMDGAPAFRVPRPSATGRENPKGDSLNQVLLIVLPAKETAIANDGGSQPIVK